MRLMWGCVQASELGVPERAPTMHKRASRAAALPLLLALLLTARPQRAAAQGLLLGDQLGATPSLGRLLDGGAATATGAGNAAATRPAGGTGGFLGGPGGVGAAGASARGAGARAPAPAPSGDRTGPISIVIRLCNAVQMEYAAEANSTCREDSQVIKNVAAWAMLSYWRPLTMHMTAGARASMPFCDQHCSEGTLDLGFNVGCLFCGRIYRRRICSPIISRINKRRQLC